MPKDSAGTVVFLDIDGVLVTARLLKQRNGRNKCARY